jgi:hypothetical protein
MSESIQEEKKVFIPPLEDWQNRLERHFNDLSRKRSDINLPVFALEHGLSLQEIEKLNNLLREYITSGQRLSTYWLLWVVYATEIGYHYTGQEFWQSFETQTPGWESHNRASLKSWFIKFQKSFNGYVPEGLWAQQFPIIAYPITHAILPVYLQYHFVRLLYTLRFKLVGLKEINSSTVGNLLSSYSYNATSRFERFLEQEELTGRIALGLLGLTPANEQEPITSDTLKRIIADLDKARNLSSWFKDTYDYVDRFKGIKPSKISNDRGARNTRESESKSGNPDLRPKLTLIYSLGNKWILFVAVSDFKPIFAFDPKIKEFLKRSRCKISGATDMKPRGWSLSGIRTSKLKSWPEPEKPLIEFEQKNEILNNILNNDCRMDAGPTWLFKIGSDGIAREVKSRNVHPGNKYILVCLDGYERRLSKLETECTLDCEGVYGLLLIIPDVLSLDDEVILGSLNLQTIRTVKVWPAGLPCRNWGGDGTSEWLSTESPTFGIVSDYPVSSYLVRIDDESVLSLNGKNTGEPYFFQIDALPPGKYRLSISAIRDTTCAKRSETISAYLDVNIRDPEQWIPGKPSHSGMIVSIDPYDADLDELWENKVNISISGPPSNSAAFSIKLFNSDHKCVLNKNIGTNFKLPLNSTSWQQQFEQLKKSHEFQYLESTTADLEINGNELGKYSLHFERKVTPLRWIARSSDKDYSLRLIDDTGCIGEPEVAFYSMEQPAKRKSLHEINSRDEFFPIKPGGLYVASHETHRDSVAISCLSRGNGFEKLGLSTDLSDILDGTIQITEALVALREWMDARLVGGLVEIRQLQIVRNLHSAIYSSLCGKDWGDIEAAYLSDIKNQTISDVLYKKITRVTSGFSAMLEKERNIFAGDLEDATEWYTALAARYDVCHDKNLCRFSIQLACTPFVLSMHDAGEFEKFLRQVKSNNSVLRGVRYSILIMLQKDDFDLVQENFRRLI